MELNMYNYKYNVDDLFNDQVIDVFYMFGNQAFWYDSAELSLEG